MPGYLEDDPTLDYLDDPDNPNRVGAPPPVPPSPISAPPIDHPPGAGDSPTIREIMAQAQPQLNQQPPVAQDLGAAQKKQADVAAQKPTPESPKWWQRLAAAGVGAAAGYTNAAGRAHVDPRAAESAIYDVPGQQRKMAEWQKQADVAQGGVDTAQTNLTTWQKMQQMRTAEEKAAADEAEKQARARKEDASNQASEGRAKLAQNEKLEQAMLKPWGEDAQLQKEGDPVPPGMETTQSLTQPGMVWVHPPKMVPLPADLATYAPGRKPDQQVPYSEFKNAQKRANDDLIRNTNKPVKDVDTVKLAIRAAGGDPNNPDSITPEIAKKASAILKPPSAAAAGGVTLTPEAMDYWAKFAGTTGQLPSLGMGNAGSKAREQILNRAPQVAGGDVSTNRAVNKADAGSLAGMQKMRDSVVAFEGTANANLDLFAKQAKAVMDSGSPWINQPLRSINRNALGNTDVAAFDAARQVALTEIAKVVNNPELSGQLSDSARKEVMGLIPENATLSQIYRVIGVLRQDMASRHKFLDKGISEIKGRMGGKQEGDGPPASYQHIAQGPNGHTIGSNDGKTWFDTQTGQAIK